MDTKKHLFYEKVQCIFNNITKKNTNEFVKLFYIEDGNTSFENRKSYIYRKWIKAEDKIINPRMFRKQYKKYPFSELIFNGRKMFSTAEEFLEADIETFCNKIKGYANILIQLDDNITKYKYLYVFNSIKNIGEIDYYQIEYSNAINPNVIQISVKPPKVKEFLNVEDYTGKAERYTDKIILAFQNRNDYISAIFNTDLINDRTQYLVGVGIGIADINQKTPVAKKVVLTKEKIEDYYSELYYVLNEIEVISAKENSYKFEQDNRDFTLNHLKKYIKKANNLNSLFKNLSIINISYKSFYRQLAFKEFSAVNSILQKVKEHRPYYVSDRSRVLEALINSYPYEKYNYLYMVIPSYSKDNIFKHLSSKALLLQEKFKELSQEVKIEIIFVLKDCKENFSYEFEEFLSKFNKSISIYFALKENLENEVNSIDLLFTDKENFVIGRYLRVDFPVFKLFQDKSIRDEHVITYRKILNRSISYQEFIDDKKRVCKELNNSILKNLIGKWYLHLYGTQKIWSAEMVIYGDNSIVLTNQEGDILKGEIIYKTNQSIILLEDIKTKRLISIIFDNQNFKIVRAFLVKVVDKKVNSDLDVFTIGIMSRHIIELEKAQEILGDVDDVRLIEPEAIKERLNRYLTEKFYY